MSAVDIDITGCRYVVFSGGIGGAKLAQGLSLCRPAEELLVVGNIGDDFEHWGLHISPDLDTLMYTLAGVASPELGWAGPVKPGMYSKGFLSWVARLGIGWATGTSPCISSGRCV